VADLGIDGRGVPPGGMDPPPHRGLGAALCTPSEGSGAVPPAGGSGGL